MTRRCERFLLLAALAMACCQATAALTCGAADARDQAYGDPAAKPAFTCFNGRPPLDATGKRIPFGNDDSKNLEKADKDPRASYIYLDRPEGTSGAVALLLRSITLSKPLVVGKPMSINVKAGETLILQGQPSFWRSELFNPRPITGVEIGGTVKFAGDRTFIVLPEWFRKGNEKDLSPALDRVNVACADVKCIVVFQWPDKLSKSFAINTHVQVWSAYSASFSTTSDLAYPAFDFQPGDYTTNQPYMLPNTDNFATAVQATNVKGLQAYIGSATTEAGYKGPYAEGVRLQGDFIESSTITVFISARLSTGYAILSKSLRSVKMFTFFWVNTFKTGAASMVNFRSLGGSKGTPGSSISYRAVDSNSENTDVSILRNDGGSPIRDFTFSLTSWGGNFPAGAKLIKGAFNNLNSFLKMDKHLDAQMTGANSVVNYGGLSNLVTVPMLSTWNPVNMALIRGNFQIVTLHSDQVPGVWKKGTTRTVYLRHALMSGGGQGRIVLSAGPISSVAYDPKRMWVNPGIVVDSIKDNSARDAGKLTIVLKNMSGRDFQPAVEFKKWEFDKKPMEFRLFVALSGMSTVKRR